MDNETRNTSDRQDGFKRRPVVKAALGLVFGAMLGLIIGNAVGSPALGLILGAGIGLTFGSALDRRRKQGGNQSKP